MRRAPGLTTALLWLASVALVLIASGSLLAPAAGAQIGKNARAAILAEVEATLTDARPDPTRAEWAGRVLGWLLLEAPNPALEAMVHRVVAEGGWPARKAVAEALPHRRGREALAATLVKDENWAVRCAALRVAGVEEALAAMTDPVWSVRWQAIRSLAGLRETPLEPAVPKRCLQSLIHARGDADREVRTEAERVLLVSRAPEAVPIYLEIFDRESARADVEAGRGVIAARALLAVGNAPVRTELRKRLTAKTRRTRILAARILQLLGENLTDRLADAHRPLADDLLSAWSEAPGPERAAAEGLAHHLGRAAARIALPRFAAGGGTGAREEIATWLVDTLGYGAPESGPKASVIASDPGRLVRVLEAPETATSARRALAHALPRLGAWAPRGWLEAEYRKTAERARARGARDLPDETSAYRTDLFTALFAVSRAAAPFETWPAVLEVALADRSVHVRGLAALAWIATTSDPKPYERIARTLATKPSGHFGRHFLRQVARRRDEAAFEFLLAAAQGTLSQKAKLRLDAVNALTSVSWSKRKQTRLAGWLARRLRTERDPGARIRMIMLLGNLDPAGALDVLARIALDEKEKPGVRVQTLNKLGASGMRRAAAPLRTLLARPDPDPRDGTAARTNARLKAAAYRALFALGRREDVPRMVKVVEIGPERTRRVALGALVKLRDPRSRAAVEALTRNGLVELDNRARGFKVLAAIGGPEIADELFKRLREEKHPEMRLGALEALALRDPGEYVDGLIHYLSTLRGARDHHERSRELFDEVLGELGKVPAPAVTRFLIDMLLEYALRPDAPARRGRRPDPMQIAARSALAGHGPERVTPVFDATLDRLAAEGPGLGIRKTFYHDLVRFLSHPARREGWGSLTADLAARARRTAPIGVEHDASMMRAVADLAFEAGRFEDAARAYALAHRIGVREGSFDRDAAAACLADDPVGRPLALASIAEALTGNPPDAEKAAARLPACVAAARFDAHVLLSAVQAAARLGRGFAFAETCLATLGPRGRDQAGALARYDLALALLTAGRKPDAFRHLALAVQDHRPLRDELERSPGVLNAFTAEERAHLLRAARSR